MTTYRSKSELERLRYHENWVNASIDASLTSRSHNFWSDHWIFEFHTFLETGSQDISSGVKIKPIQDHLKVVAIQGPLPHNLCQGYKINQAPLDQKKRDFPRSYSLPGRFLHIFTLFQKHF